MKSIIIDDEIFAIQIIKEFLDDFPEIIVIGEFHDGFEGLKAINELKPDLVFLDISMSKLTGLEMIELLDEMPQIIFTTAYDEYAVNAFEKDATDYLLKPFSKKRFAQAIEKANKRHAENTNTDYSDILENLQNKSDSIDRIVVKECGKIFIIPVEDVYYISAAEDYTVIATKDKEFVKHATMKFFEEKLPSKNFVRIHRSSIININYIKEIQPFTKDTLSVIMNNGKVLKASRQGNSELKDMLK
ncbi:MAG: LytTR family transcriptional regulator DNA-binding domain-containing protein [Bacteroidales bacterium]|jgi:two-component system LytT family response regulator|nr:LytTR family transcriptional regulator DNA-binding domain-containing protein [Bacteroidales bacterium]